jgi:hypothetical protein
MSAPQKPIPEGAPLMQAWLAYKGTPEFANTLSWAGKLNEGSLWAAFVEGWKAAGGEMPK